MSYKHALEEAMKALEIVKKLPRLVGDICERRELEPCWFVDGGDCGNWATCSGRCPLRQLRNLVDIVPQMDGGMDKQPVNDDPEVDNGK